MPTRTVITYIFAAVVAIILGGLVGWYFFLNTRSKETVAQDTSRGYDTSAPTSASGGSLVSRVLSNITGQGTGVSPTPSNTPFEQSPDAQAPQSGVGAPAKRPPQLWHVHTKPVAGMSFVRGENTERLRYVERATGYVYEARI